MSSLNQKTIKKSIYLEGVGLHSGKKVSMTIFPAKTNSGIIFKRVDIKKNNFVVPNVYNVSNASFCTTISNENGVCISTIEHLMAAFYGLGVDNALIEIDSHEVPILDGSAKIFVDEILKVGLEISEIPIKIIKNGLEKFSGVQRRMTKLFSINKNDFYDDYAHCNHFKRTHSNSNREGCFKGRTNSFTPLI